MFGFLLIFGTLFHFLLTSFEFLWHCTEVGLKLGALELCSRFEAERGRRSQGDCSKQLCSISIFESALFVDILEFILVANFSWKAISVATHPHSWPRWSRFIGRATSFRQQAGNFLPGKQKNEQMWKLSGRTSVKLRGNRGGMKKTLSCSDGWPTL